MNPIPFKYMLDPQKQVNIRLLDSIYDNAPNISNMLSQLKDLAYVDINQDPDIETTESSSHLHKINQYTLQYLLHTIESQHNYNNLLKDKLKILQNNQEQRNHALTQQEDKIDRMEQKLKDCNNQNEHQKYVINEEKLNQNERDFRVNTLVDKLKSEFEEKSDTIKKVHDTGNQNSTNKNNSGHSNNTQINEHKKQPDYKNPNGSKSYQYGGYSSRVNQFDDNDQKSGYNKQNQNNYKSNNSLSRNYGIGPIKDVDDLEDMSF